MVYFKCTSSLGTTLDTTTLLGYFDICFIYDKKYFGIALSLKKFSTLTYLQIAFS